MSRLLLPFAVLVVYAVVGWGGRPESVIPPLLFAIWMELRSGNDRPRGPE